MTEQTTIAAPTITRNRQLSVDELKTIPIPMQIQDGKVILDCSLKGWKLKQPVILSLDKVLATKEKGFITYILTAFISERPNLIPFVFDNQTLIKMARHFLRHCSGSIHSCYSYTATIEKYSTWLGYSPDLIIQDTKPIGNIPDPQRVQNHQGYLDEYIAELQDEGLSPGRVHCYAKHIKTFYKVNGVKIELSEPLSRRVTYKDRAPKPEEIAKLLDIADLREKAIISMLALGAFREETLSKLQYRHVQEDLETNRVPIHVHVEAEITKGKYHDYDTFLGPEAAQFLKLYIEHRKKGTKSPARNPNPRITALSRRNQSHSSPNRIKTTTQKSTRPLQRSRTHQTKKRTHVRPARAQPKKILQNPNDSIRCPIRLRRLHDGTHSRHLPRHPKPRHGQTPKHLRSSRPIHQTKNTNQQSRSPQRNHPRVGHEPRTNPSQKRTS